MSFESPKEIERKILAILKVLSNLQKPAGSVIIAKELKIMGVDLSERAIRYHLKLTDERGFTRLVTERDGRVITDKGRREIERAMVNDKVGFAISRIERLSFLSNFDFEKRAGNVPVNISFFPEEKFLAALKAMEEIFEKGYCVSTLVAFARGGQFIGNLLVPSGMMGLGTICSIITNGALLKAGVPMDSRFGGIMQMVNERPIRFTEIIHYNGSSLDPSEIFIKAGMTTVTAAATTGNGEILANFREIPAICQPVAVKVIEGLKQAGFSGVLSFGDTSAPVCEIAVDLNKIGIVLVGGLNPVAAAAEQGFPSIIHSMSTVVDYNVLVSYKEVMKRFDLRERLSVYD
ncbi:MAG TPA: NrpR regulatory domain-containing protein [Dehalococcoidales bacterium]|nr:NrpR regulatory domain-containing protein [Dehalococcoidales bacterium]